MSDDSDIEVHPNVDKRSFIRAKQNQIHQERLQRKNRIAALKYERVINSALLGRIESLLDALKAHAAEAAAGNVAEIGFKIVMGSASNVEDDQPPPRPEGVFVDDEPIPPYSKMLLKLLDQVHAAVEKKKPDDYYAATLEEILEHVGKIKQLQKEQADELEKLEKEEGKKITSDNIHDGFNSSYVNKSGTSQKKEGAQVELLNPNFSTSAPALASGTPSSDGDTEKEEEEDDDDNEIEASPAGKEFAAIRADDNSASERFLMRNPEILTERETDGLLVMAFDAALERKDDLAHQFVHQALLLQYCRALGENGAALLFSRINTKGHKARDVFHKDVQGTYMKIKNRALEIIAERAKEPAEGVEQIQLHAVEPGTAIQITIPAADSEDADVQASRKIYESFDPEMKKALESGELDEVNKVLGNMKLDDAEELVGLFGEANILSLEEELIDATTEEGQQQLRELEEAAKREAVGDPE
ncbi:cell division cycle 37 [Trichoderma cornu-damae]|uniref:Hsp90 chaperone protein kinase-targeting subunit n=1 Tax=Trichoderma cornu-damae TaxID=654480 RepID=A0A9P8QVC8_9HYPO|nr:cell division cycle 37 [Trichoderma cornu-damae]